MSAVWSDVITPRVSMPPGSTRFSSTATRATLEESRAPVSRKPFEELFGKSGMVFLRFLVWCGRRRLDRHQAPQTAPGTLLQLTGIAGDLCGEAREVGGRTRFRFREDD